jgi:hypothetical protein
VVEVVEELDVCACPTAINSAVAQIKPSNVFIQLAFLVGFLSCSGRSQEPSDISLPQLPSEQVKPWLRQVT